MKTPEQIDEEFECQKCHALFELGDGLIPTKYCNLCAQELVESMVPAAELRPTIEVLRHCAREDGIGDLTTQVARKEMARMELTRLETLLGEKGEK